jgi:5-methylcytosine-specific restriction endonuclease McrA
MWRCPTSCGIAGCRQPTVRGFRWCAKHREEGERLQREATEALRLRNRESHRESDKERYKNDATRRMYGAARWEHFRQAMLGQNPICQRLLRFGQGQCHNPAMLVHHLISPRTDVEKFLDPQNVVCLCEHCHPSEEGTPHWRAGVDYVLTRFRLPNVG